MICEACHGEGYVRGKDEANPGALVMLPCLECMGSGIASCCDAAGSSSPAIKRLIEEVRNGDGATTGYNRIYNRHNR